MSIDSGSMKGFQKDVDKAKSQVRTRLYVMVVTMLVMMIIVTVKMVLVVAMSDNGGYNDISGGRDYIDDGGSIGNNGSGNSKQ